MSEGGGGAAAVPAEHTAVCLQREHLWSAYPGLLPQVCVLSSCNPLYIPLAAHLLFFFFFLSLTPPHNSIIPLILAHSQSLVCLNPRLECFHKEGK